MKNEILDNEFDFEDYLRTLEPEETSSSFTDNVMQAISLADEHVMTTTRVSSLWLWLLIPFVAVSLWLISFYYNIGAILLPFGNHMMNYWLHAKNILLYIPDKVSHNSTAPMIWAGLTAAILLLTIEELINKRDLLHRKNLPKGI